MSDGQEPDAAQPESPSKQLWDFVREGADCLGDYLNVMSIAIDEARLAARAEQELADAGLDPEIGAFDLHLTNLDAMIVGVALGIFGTISSGPREIIAPLVDRLEEASKAAQAAMSEEETAAVETAVQKAQKDAYNATLARLGLDVETLDAFSRIGSVDGEQN